MIICAMAMCQCVAICHFSYRIRNCSAYNYNPHFTTNYRSALIIQNREMHKFRGANLEIPCADHAILSLKNIELVDEKIWSLGCHMI